MAEVFESPAPTDAAAQGTKMEEAFIPCSRLPELFSYGRCQRAFYTDISDHDESQQDGDSNGDDFAEVELAASGREMLMNASLEWTALVSLLYGKIGWLGQCVLVACGTAADFDGYKIGYHGVLDLHELAGIIIWATRFPSLVQAQVITDGCDFVLRCLESHSTPRSVRLAPFDFESAKRCPFSEQGLSRFLTECKDIQEIELEHYIFDEGQCHALVTGVRDDVKFELHSCECIDTPTGRAPAEKVFFDGIGGNRGPTSLLFSHFDTMLLAEALRGNSRVTKLHLDPLNFADGGDSVPPLLQALDENLGLTTLILRRNPIDDDSWSVMCQSLMYHPALEELDLVYTASHDASSRSLYPGMKNWEQIQMSQASKTRRTESLLAMMQVNTVLTMLYMAPEEVDQGIWCNEIEPLVAMNKHRPRTVAIQKAGEYIRPALFGRALHAVNNSRMLLNMFLKANVDLVAGKCRVPSLASGAIHQFS